jgi:hypothetical protein
MTEPGLPIHVALVTEASDVARSSPPWIAGFTIRDAVVVFPARSPSYPNDTVEDVLRHELAHATIWRVSRGNPIPRWFNEGLAMAAERERGFQDQTQLLYQLVSGPRTTLDEIDRLFDGNQSQQTRAYALSGAIVHDLLERRGPASGGEVVQEVGTGIPFESAFARVFGTSATTAEFEFWQRQRIWTNWVPILTSTATLWLAITLLALVAIYRRWRKNVAIAEQWEDEDDDDSMD